MASEETLRATGQWDFANNCPIGKQVRGEPLVLTEEMEVVSEKDRYYQIVGKYHVTASASGLHIEPIEKPEVIEGNFAFYVDGYTIKLEDETDPEFSDLLCTAPDGRTCIIKKSSLTAFIDRRIDE